MLHEGYIIGKKKLSPARAFVSSIRSAYAPFFFHFSLVLPFPFLRKHENFRLQALSLSLSRFFLLPKPLKARPCSLLLFSPCSFFFPFPDAYACSHTNFVTKANIHTCTMARARILIMQSSFSYSLFITPSIDSIPFYLVFLSFFFKASFYVFKFCSFDQFSLSFFPLFTCALICCCVQHTFFFCSFTVDYFFSFIYTPSLEVYDEASVYFDEDILLFRNKFALNL